jgi:hypothetical protein
VSPRGYTLTIFWRGIVEKTELSFMGGMPPVTVTATNGAKVDFNFSVRFVVEVREPDTLRRWAENLSKMTTQAVLMALL